MRDKTEEGKTGKLIDIMLAAKEGSNLRDVKLKSAIKRLVIVEFDDGSDLADVMDALERRS